MQNAIRTAFAGILFAGSLTAVAAAQGLPPAPKAQAQSGTVASRRGDSGGALEPYLITLLLPFGGIVMAAAGYGADRRLRALGHG